jgi:hypothetical protein
MIYWWTKEGWKPWIVGYNMRWPMVVYVEWGEGRLCNLIRESRVSD